MFKTKKTVKVWKYVYYAVYERVNKEFKDLENLKWYIWIETICINNDILFTLFTYILNILFVLHLKIFSMKMKYWEFTGLYIS